MRVIAAVLVTCMAVSLAARADDAEKGDAERRVDAAATGVRLAIQPLPEAFSQFVFVPFTDVLSFAIAAAQSLFVPDSHYYDYDTMQYVEPDSRTPAGSRLTRDLPAPKRTRGGTQKDILPLPPEK